MHLWPVEHFFPHFLTVLLCTHSKTVKKWGKNVQLARGAFKKLSLRNSHFSTYYIFYFPFNITYIFVWLIFLSGYWTDNGAYYYYKTLEGLNYEDTLIELRKNLDELQIPARYLEVFVTGSPE